MQTLTVVAMTVVLALASVILQVGVVILMVQYTTERVRRAHGSPTAMAAAWTLAVSTTGLFLGHLTQIALWAAVFLGVGEFDSYELAYYHSAVNFASLGYGDIVMKPPWRLMGALEAVIGVLMAGISTALVFWLMSRIFEEKARRRQGDALPDSGGAPGQEV